MGLLCLFLSGFASLTPTYAASPASLFLILHAPGRFGHGPRIARQGKPRESDGFHVSPKNKKGSRFTILHALGVV
jgi:hypothetical protein